MTNKATLKKDRASYGQAQKLLAIFEDTPPDRLQAIFASGLLADVRDANLDVVDRDEFRRVLGLKPRNAPAQIIDLDADPSCPDGWEVAEHRKGGRLEWSPEKARLFLAEDQCDEGLFGHDLRKEIAGENPFNACLLDWLLDHPEEIPESWKGKAVLFWGTIYRDRRGDLCVRCLYCGGGRRCWPSYGLDNRLNAEHPALVPAS